MIPRVILHTYVTCEIYSCHTISFSWKHKMNTTIGASSSRNFASLTCSLCTELTAVKFASTTVGDYIKHLRLFHAHRPDFKVVCGINGCIRSYSNLGSFKNHISFMHSTECEHRAMRNLQGVRHSVKSRTP